MKYTPLILLVFSSIACNLTLYPVTPAPAGNAPQVMEAKPAAVPTPIRSATVNTHALHIRVDSTYHSNALNKYLYQGQTITVLECKSGWARVGKDQWVRSFFLDGGCP